MSYVAPDGNTYKYYYETDRYVGTQSHNNYDYKIWSNVKIAGQTFKEYSNGSYLIGIYDEDSDSVGQLWIGQYSNIPEIQGYSGFNSGGLITYRQLNGQIYMTTISGNSASANAYIAIKPNNSYFTYASSISEMKAYLIAPEVFQIPSFSFSGSILPGQNSSLSQGSCSLARPYTTSFSFEGKCIEKYSAPNGKVYNYKCTFSTGQNYDFYSNYDFCYVEGQTSGGWPYVYSVAKNNDDLYLVSIATHRGSYNASLIGVYPSSLNFNSSDVCCSLSNGNVVSVNFSLSQPESTLQSLGLQKYSTFEAAFEALT